MKYESLLEFCRARDAGKEKVEHWRVCPKCMDAFLGTAGEECSQCGGVCRPSPLFKIDMVEQTVCDGCRWKVTGEVTEIGRFKICERCMKVDRGERVPLMKKWEREKIEKALRRARAITELMEVRSGN